MRAYLLLIALALAPAVASPAPDTRLVALSGGVEAAVDVYAADGEHLLLWVAPGFGFRQAHARMAQRLAQVGLEVWQVDLAEALFLPRGSAAMRSIEGRYVADLIERANRATGKRIVLVGESSAAVPVLRGIRAWQSRGPQSAAVAGAVLFSPNAYAGIPALGMDPTYLPVVRETNVPIMLVQSGARGNRWQLPALVEALRAGGATVYTQVLPGVNGLFHDEGARARQAEPYLRDLPQRLRAMVSLLARSPLPLQPAPPAAASDTQVAPLDSRLKPYRGNPRPPGIALPDVNGRRLTLTDYTGRVTVVNFWATWCPPCVEEIPSLNRLRQAMADLPFELVSVNYAEDAESVRSFLQRVQVDFPVLLDGDGREAARWKVLAFPSTFVIGPDGRIRYGVNAAIHWDDPEVVRALRRLAAPAAKP